MLDRLITKHCCLCNVTTHSALELCPACQNDLPLNTYACSRCGIPVHKEDRICVECETSPAPINRTLTPFLYEAGIKHLISSLKFAQDLPTANLLAKLFLEKIDVSDLTIDYLLPVPSHNHRMRERGFNQAHEIGKALSQTLQIPILTSIQKQKYTAPQTTLSARQRKTNLKQAFTIKKDIPPARIAIVDDVITTGTTMNEIAQLLRKQGIQHIEAWAIARTE